MRNYSGGIFDYDVKVERLEEVTRELESPEVWNDPERAQALGKERSALELIVETIKALEIGCDEILMLVELAVDEQDQDTFDEAANETLELRKKNLKSLNFVACFRVKMTVVLVTWIFNLALAERKLKIGPICYCACIYAGAKPMAIKQN